MTRLEELKAGVAGRGIAPVGLVKVVGVNWYGDQAIKVVYEGEDGTVGNRLLYRHDEPSLEVEPDSRSWPSDGDGALLVVDEAHKKSASYTRGEVKYTKRYRLGEFLGERRGARTTNNRATWRLSKALGTSSLVHRRRSGRASCSAQSMACVEGKVI